MCREGVKGFHRGKLHQITQACGNRGFTGILEIHLEVRMGPLKP